MAKFLKILMLALIIVSCSKEEKNVEQDYNLVIETDGGEVKYLVENAVSHEELQKGLMFRDSIAPNTGMIFNLKNVGPVAMWMKNTKISLDMLFVNDEGKIVWIYENAVPFSEEQIVPPVASSYVIEINAGEASKNNIAVGNGIRHSFIGNFSEVVDKAVAETVETPTEPEAISDNVTTDFEEVDVTVEQPVVEAPVEQPAQ